MKKKLVYLSAMVCLVLLAVMAQPRTAAAISCSGDFCGCDAAEQVCAAECPPVGDPAHNSCVHECSRGSIQCAVCCCCEAPACPLYCGG